MTHKLSLRTAGPFEWRRHWSARLHSWVSTGLLALALGGISLLVLAAQSKAADLQAGGDCCTDLEERVAELEATTARKGNRKVSLTVYGQVNQAVMYFDPDIEDVDSEVSIVDNQNSESRFGFKGEAKINKDWSAGFRIEIGLDQKGEPGDPASDYGLNIRHSYWYLDSKQLGKLTIGHTSTATDNLDSISTSNRVVALKTFGVEPVGSAVLMGFTLPFDGGREGVVKYDTPIIGGFQLTAAWIDEGATDNEQWDVALRYAGEFGDIRLAGGVGYAHGGDIDLGIVAVPVDNNRFNATGSIMHTPSGLFLDGSYAQIEIDGVDLDVRAWHVVGGIETRVNSLGKTTFFGEYAQINLDAGGDSLDPSWYGLGLVQAIDAAAMDLYITYRKYDLDVDVSGVGDPQQVVAGARISF